MAESNAPKFGIAAVLSVLAYIYHSMGALFVVLVLVSSLDYVTGIIAAGVRRELHSRRSFEGILRKIALLCLVPLAILIDFVLAYSGYIHTDILYVAVTSWLIATEALSIIENVAGCGVPIPAFLVGILAVFGPTERYKSKRRKRK